MISRIIILAVPPDPNIVAQILPRTLGALGLGVPLWGKEKRFAQGCLGSPCGASFWFIATLTILASALRLLEAI